MTSALASTCVVVRVRSGCVALEMFALVDGLGRPPSSVDNLARCFVLAVRQSLYLLQCG